MLVMDRSSAPIYSKFLDPNFNMDPAMMAGLMSAIQMFASEISTGSIKEFAMQNMKILYRQIEGFTFLGLVDNDNKIKHIDLILEYIIWVFLAKYKGQLAIPNAIHDLEAFRSFDEVFLQFQSAKEKELQRCVENTSTGLLQCMLNKLANLFPVTELIGVSDVLKIIGKKLVWVDINIPGSEEARIMTLLKQKTDMVYGPGMFDSIKQEIIKNAKK